MDDTQASAVHAVVYVFVRWSRAHPRRRLPTGSCANSILAGFLCSGFSQRSPRSFATRTDADHSRGAASASGEADVSSRGNGGRSRLAGSGPEETSRVARADRSTVCRACPRARSPSWFRYGRARLASVASTSVRQGAKASVDHRRRNDASPLRTVRLVRDSGAAIHIGVDDGRGMEGGSTHAMDRN